MIESVDILGVRVDRVTTAQTLDLIDGYIEERTPHQVTTVNPEFVVQARSNARFAQVLAESALALPDGAGLLWAARFLGSFLPERVTGSDSVPLIAERASAKGHSIYFLGAAPGVAEQTAKILQERYPGLGIAGCYAGSPSPDEQAEIVDRVRAAKPDILLVAYGAPNQDLWIHRNLVRLDVPVCIGVGGTFDFITGFTRRAPKWMRDMGIEWLFRLLIEPWRWRRMLALPRFVWYVLGQRLSSGARRQ